MEISGLCCNTQPFAQPRARLSGCLLIPWPSCLLLAWGTLASLSSPAQAVTQRSCAVLCRALSSPDLLPPSHGPSKTSLAQRPRVVGAGVLSTSFSWALVSRRDVAQRKREFSIPPCTTTGTRACSRGPQGHPWTLCAGSHRGSLCMLQLPLGFCYILVASPNSQNVFQMGSEWLLSRGGKAWLGWAHQQLPCLPRDWAVSRRGCWG